MRVLVVEDERKTASFIRKALQAEGFAVDVCRNGDDALALAGGTPFDGIAQWIVSAHNGSIQMKSGQAGLTTVTVRLPLLQESAMT